jgi:hypothetical protein
MADVWLLCQQWNLHQTDLSVLLLYCAILYIPNQCQENPSTWVLPMQESPLGNLMLESPVKIAVEAV